MDQVIDTLIVLCAGKSADFLMHRKRTLKRFRSRFETPVQGTHLGIDNDEWADLVGGCIVGERV